MSRGPRSALLARNFDALVLVEETADVRRVMLRVSCIDLAVRAAIDEMRDNQKVDVVVVFAPDRSDEPAERSVFINQFASAAHYATTGTMKFTGLLDTAGTPITELTYPVPAFDSGGVLGSATFGAANVGVDVKCVVTTLSGE